MVESDSPPPGPTLTRADALRLGNRTRQELPRELSHEPYRNLPLLEALDESGDNTPRIEFYRDMIRHETCECGNGNPGLCCCRGLMVGRCCEQTMSSGGLTA